LLSPKFRVEVLVSSTSLAITTVVLSVVDISATAWYCKMNLSRGFCSGKTPRQVGSLVITLSTPRPLFEMWS